MAGSLVSGTITIPQAVSDQVTVDRAVHLSVPTGTGPHPLIVLLHGLGGSGERLLGKWTDRKHARSALAQTHILAAPDGEDKSWNIVDEPSRLPDVCFVEQLVEELGQYPNVSTQDVGLFGFSNGAALVNRLLIESDDRRLTHAITDASQLNVWQFHEGTFFVGGIDNAYCTPKPALVRRSLLALQGVDDDTVPASGGEGKVPCRMAPSGKLGFLSGEASAFAFACAFGHEGAPCQSRCGADGTEEVTYLGGELVSLRVSGAGHGSLGCVEPRVMAFLTTRGKVERGELRSCD